MSLRRSELVVLAGGLTFVLLLVWSFRAARRPATGRLLREPPAATSDSTGEATTLLDGFDFTETVGGKPLLRIKAARTVGYGPGAGLAPDLYAGENVTLTVYPDDGAPVTVNAERGDYDERTRESKLQGNVRWSDAEGSLAETDEVRFHPSAHVLEAPHPVHFTQGSIDLVAPSARYDLRDRGVRLAGPISGSASGEDAGGLSKLTAREGLFRRDQGLLELQMADGESRSGDRFAADHVTVKTGASGGRAEWIRGEGNVRGVLASEPPAGSPRVDRRYAADQSLLALDSAGKTRSLTFSGAPAILSEPRQRLTARQIDITFVDGRAVSARASGGLRLEGENGRAEAAQGSLGIAPDGSARNIVLEGEVQVEADGRKGEAARAVEIEAPGVWVLTGDSGRSARAESAGSRLSADRIKVDRAHGIVVGEGRARAIFSPDPKGKTRTATFVGDPKRPTYGRADRISLDESGQNATLSGGASLWQGNSALFADDITLSDSDRSVTAVQNVRAVITPQQTPKSGERAPSVVTAKRLVYHETDRSGRFEGGVVVTRGANWRATGGESTAWLDKDGGVDCMEISGNVDLEDHTVGRTAKAEKALDYPRQGKTLLWGSPARVTDASGNKVAGAILTILDRGRSVEITAPEGGKTETIHRTEKD